MIVVMAMRTENVNMVFITVDFFIFLWYEILCKNKSTGVKSQVSELFNCDKSCKETDDFCRFFITVTFLMEKNRVNANISYLCINNGLLCIAVICATDFLFWV